MTDRSRTVVSASSLGYEPDPRGRVDLAAATEAVRMLLEAIGEDLSRPALADTPRRVAEAYTDLLAGSAEDPIGVLEVLDDERGDGLIMVRDIPLASMCEHHLLPFIGHATVAYLPGDDGRITGLSKLPRLVSVLSRRLQVQERLVREIADAIDKALSPRGIFVLIEAEQLCMTVRGARTKGAITVTTDARGVFADDPSARAELLALSRGR